MLILFFLVTGCELGREAEKEMYIMRSGQEEVSLSRFHEAMNMAKTIYSVEELGDKTLIESIRLRVLKELKEGVVLSRIASDFGLSVSDEELESRVDDIRNDYPEGEFEEVLLENVISLRSWKESLRERMLKEKVVRVCLEEKIEVPPEDLKKYYNEMEKGRDSGKEDQTSNETLLLRYRKEKAEARYDDWIAGYQKKFPVEINAEVWERLSAGKQ